MRWCGPWSRTGCVPGAWCSRSPRSPRSRTTISSPRRSETSPGSGFAFAVDDVGAGYSGLEKIARLEPRYLKFDRELVRSIDSSYIRREMTRALKAFADRIGSTIIAEGIESDAELATLLELGIEYGQGFLLGRPAAGFPGA